MASRAASTSEPGKTWLVYDGECPFCSRYVRYLKLREALPNLRLIDARAGGPAVAAVYQAGHDLDEGMVLRVGQRWYHGADCLHALALMSTPAGPFNRLNAALFRSETWSRRLYPWLRAGRNAALYLLGRKKLGTHSA
jgi:predicted DCC family thiol-disulfide oxidoreductase YuxK